MMRMAMSPAAASLLRALALRAGVERNRILLIDARSTDWQSLTFSGERHRMTLRITGADSAEIGCRLTTEIEDAEFDLQRFILADIAVADGGVRAVDGATEIAIEALTIASD